VEVELDRRKLDELELFDELKLLDEYDRWVLLELRWSAARSRASEASSASAQATAQHCFMLFIGSMV
jgi:hypothetical protein